MISEDSPVVDELVLSRELADGNRIEVRQLAGAVVIRLFNAHGLHYSTHFSRNCQEALDAVAYWDGTGLPFVE